MMDRREYQLFLREPNLEFDIKVEIESNCGTNLDKYMLNKLNYYDYDRNTSFNQYKNPIRYPSKSSSPSFLSSSSPPSQSIQRMSPKPAVMLPYILPNLDTKLLTENPSRLLCLLEEMLLSRGLYMVPFQSPIHSYRIGKQLGGFNSNEMIAYRGGRRNDALYEDNDIAFLGSRSEDTRPMSNSPSPIYLPTTQSIRPLPTKIYLRDVSIQCDITQKYSMNNESQIQAKKNHSIDASVYCKPSDIVKKSDMQEVEIMTNMSAIKSPLRTKQKSVRIMVRPHSRSVKLQTPSSMASYKSENRSIKSPMCKNLCISVDKTHRQSVSSPHSTISSTLSPNNNNNHINATANYGSHSPFSPLGDAESVHSIETDSWVWPTTPSMKSDKNSSSQLLSNTLDNEIIEKDNSQKNNSC
uniref:Uncharacterized protein n=1 Tax=Trichobilharzia regenti TaxID=157069 RepID=A0AA85JUC0_TRIRE|nr:unnamed protein product [Trichobilharzia regenti]